MKIELPYDLAISLEDIHPENMNTLFQKDTRTPKFIATLFTKAKSWKQPKRPSTNDRFKKKGIHIYNGYFSPIKKDKIVPLAPM